MATQNGLRFDKLDLVKKAVAMIIIIADFHLSNLETPGKFVLSICRCFKQHSSTKVRTDVMQI